MQLHITALQSNSEKVKAISYHNFISVTLSVFLF